VAARGPSGPGGRTASSTHPGIGRAASGRPQPPGIVGSCLTPTLPFGEPPLAASLYNPKNEWRCAIHNDAGIKDRVLRGVSPEIPPEEAQSLLLHQVEEQTGQRYDATWTQDKPHWWSAELIPAS
jgi:hypothetical protein